MEDGKFSRYEIRGELGKGGMAKVYRAYDPYSGREVALKILRRDMLEDPEFRERFDREMKIVAQLEFDGIVQVYDFGRDEKEPLFFVMRLMAGGTLSERIENGLLSAAQITRIVQRIAPVLDQAHQRGIIHRDLKPKNILFDENDNAFISDFGVAKAIDKSALNTMTDSGVIVGTPRYMSPEQANGEKVDVRSDIYSLGVIAFEMLVGQTNFDTITPWGLALDRETNLIPRLLDTNPALTPGVRVVMEKVLAKDRNLRYGSATEFANAITSALSEPLEPTKPVAHAASFPVRFWVIGGFIVLALVSFAMWGYPALVPPIITPTSTATVTITPSTTVVPPTPTSAATQTPAETAIATVIPPPGGVDRIALTANNEIYLIDSDGTNLQPLTRTGLPKFDLQWLPGGSELLYVEGKCVYTIQVEPAPMEPDQLACFNDPKFMGFRVSPDGQQAALSIANRLLVLPFDRATLSTVSSAFELQKLESLCLDYADVTVKGAQWSADGQRLAIRYQTVVSISNRIGDVIRVIEGDWDRCQKVPVVVWDDFPADHFVPNGYERYSLLPSYQWDGSRKFLLNSLIRNQNYGDLYLYDMSTKTARQINPIAGLCCYGSAAFSTDGTYLLLVFQDLRDGPNSRNQLYYIPMDQMGSAELTPLPLPGLFFRDPRENIQLALRSFAP